MQREILSVNSGSIAQKAGVMPGWFLNGVNGKTDIDIIDYMIETSKRNIEFEFSDKEGKTRTITIFNRDYEPLGINFCDITLDETMVCKNNCCFCFMNQLPKNMRRTLYFKDDDYRLSFICGNYVTLTNVTDDALNRIIDKKLDPVNVSVHTTNPALRARMMKNPNAGRIMDQLRKLADGGISFNVQLVLCPGINDGEELERTLSDLMELAGAVNSLSCVPVGLTKHRQGLEALRLFDNGSAEAVIKTTDIFRKKAEERFGRGIFCVSDEFFILAGREFPEDAYYEGYAQYENGVGMARSFIDEVTYELDRSKKGDFPSHGICVVTGILGEKILKDAACCIAKAAPQVKLSVEAIKNEFFGENITASGLVCGRDIIAQTRGLDGDIMMIPSNMLNEDKLFLDNLCVGDIQNKTGMRVIVSHFGGAGFIDTLKGINSL